MKKIYFNGLGMATNKTDVGNYRVASCFKNNKDQLCFLEVSHIDKDGVLYGYIQQAYRIEGQREYHCYRTFNDMYNSTFLFTKENIIRYVNFLFECNFTEMETISRSDERWVGNNKQVIK